MQDSDRALELAYRYLNRRERTTSEVRRHLAAKGTAATVIEAAIHELSEQGILDDARFVRLFAQDKRELEQWGSERIRGALLARGVERELLATELPWESPTSELDRAVDVLRRRFPDPPRDRRSRNRALGLLLRKGYDGDLALDALAAHARD